MLFFNSYICDHAVSIKSVADFVHMDAHKLRSYYRDHLSNFRQWNQKRHASEWVLFGLFDDIKTFYFLAQHLGYIYHKYEDKSVAMAKMALWFNKVEEQNYTQFDTVVKTFKNHYDRILDYFNNRQTNASAEAFNRKLKSFRREFRGVNDIDFYMYRIKNLYA